MALQRAYNPQRTTTGKSLNNFGGKNPQKTAPSPQLTITPRMLNSIKASPKGQLPTSLNKFLPKVNSRRMK